MRDWREVILDAVVMGGAVIRDRCCRLSWHSEGGSGNVEEGINMKKG